MRRDKNDRPALEFQARAHAREIYFYVVGEPETHTEGTTRVEHVRERDGLPSPVMPHVRYKDVHISTHIAAWLT
jgi:hypothetical protein